MKGILAGHKLRQKKRKNSREVEMMKIYVSVIRK
jgi:hypothetical protein